MNKVSITQTVDLSTLRQPEGAMPLFTAEDYRVRLELLLEKMDSSGMTHVLVYADREHFSNMEYLTGYDPRFEESILIIGSKGELTVLVGNEGWGYADVIPLKFNKVLYQNFSLQGQPRQNLVSLRAIFKENGICIDSTIGMIGFKYFDKTHIEDHEHMHDVPAYIIDQLSGIVPRDRIYNFTQVMTHADTGIRMTIRSTKEIAYFEYAANKASNCLINMLCGLKPGISELDLSKKAGYDASPINLFPVINFGEAHIRLGLRSPGDKRLVEGEPAGVTYGIRGANIARSGLAVHDVKGITSSYKGCMDDFYMPYFAALANWYQSLAVGADCGHIYDSVMDLIGDDKFGVGLNPGHNIGMDEWTNSPFFKASKYQIKSGCYLQCDIIAMNRNPVKQAIMEDGVIIADDSLRKALAQECPDTYRRISTRREFIENIIGINLSDDVLPLSNCQAVYHPFMLDTEKIFTL